MFADESLQCLFLLWHWLSNAENEASFLYACVHIFRYLGFVFACHSHKYLELVFLKNNYNAHFIRRNTIPVTTVTIPDIKGTSESISRILQPYNIHVAHKPTASLRHILTNVKDSDEPNNRQEAVYKR